MSDSQKQVAEENANQIQVNGNLIIQNRVDFKEAFSIFDTLKTACVELAVSQAKERVKTFEDKLRDRIEKLEERVKVLESFSDPSFQVSLMNAQKSAACSENGISIDILTELIISRVNKGDNVQNRIGINHAIEIIDQVDATSLCAVTVLYAVENYIYTAGNPISGLQELNKLYSSLMQQALPRFGDKLWLDGLDILKVIRISRESSFKKFSDYFPTCVPGYSSAGIAKDSSEYQEAQKILEEANVSFALVDNIFMPGYARLNVVDEAHLDKILAIVDIDGKKTSAPLNAEEIEAFHKVWGLYTKDQKVNKAASEAFMKEADSFPAIKKIHEWWDSFPFYFEITRAGSAIAYTNAKLIAPDLPELPF